MLKFPVDWLLMLPSQVLWDKFGLQFREGTRIFRISDACLSLVEKVILCDSENYNALIGHSCTRHICMGAYLC